MKSKQKALLTDLLALIGKYSIRDWEPILRFLRARKSRIPEMIAAIDGLNQTERSKPRAPRPSTYASKESDAKKPAVSRTSKRRSKAEKGKPSRIGERTAELEVFILERLGATSTKGLQSMYVRAIGPKLRPAGRDIMIRKLSKYLLHAPQKARAALLVSLRREHDDPTENYRRWTRMISGQTKGR